ncbi:tape measure protein [Shewanella sp. WXL01]|uniref:tape measure protein n=1 Tax=Shewanella sp. WXL01 TaxID=2709721 RepID=UPI0014383A5E|nr:tape measure protein [Shewanella sp. WXL01]NKF51361.1 tape measure protein [Shewanella sp. WXL01]
MSDLKVALTLTADGKQLVGTVNQTEKVVSNLNTQLNKSQTAGASAALGLSKVEQQSNKTATTLKHMSHMAVGAFAGLSGINLAQKVTNDLAAFQDVRTRLEGLSGSTAAYAANEQFLIDLTSRHSKELIPLADGYSKLLTLQDAGLVTQTQAKQLLEGLSNAQSATGASTTQLDQAMYGLQQALASGVVRAEEFNQVTEPMGNLINKIAKAAGVSTGEFRKMINTGKVTSDMFRDTLIKALEEYDGAAAATGANISAQMNQMTNEYQQMLVAFEEPINDGTSLALGTITDGIKLLTDNADTLQTVLGVSVVAVLGRVTAALYTKTSATIRDIAADKAARVAAIAAAEAELQRASVQRAAVLTSGQAIAAEARLLAATDAVTAAKKRATVATKAMNSVMALAGGPAGLALIAASSIGYLAYQASEAKDPMEGLASEVDKLNDKLGTMNDAQRSIAVSKLSTKMQEYRDEIASSQAEIDDLIKSGFSGSDSAVMFSVKRIEQLKSYIATLEAQLNDASAAQQKLFNVGLPELTNTTPDPAATATITKQQQTLLDNYAKQSALLGETSEAAKVRYAIEHGALKDLDPEINAQILTAAKAVDTQKQAAAAAKTQATEIKALLAALDPTTAATNEMAAKQKLLQAYFKQTNVPLERQKALLDALKNAYQEDTGFSDLRNQLDPAYAEQQTHDQNLGILNAELEQTPETEALKRNQINLLIEAEQQRHAEAMKQINGGVAMDFDQLWENSIDRFSSGIGQVTADALFEAQDFGEGVQSLLKGVGKAAVQMLVEWMAQRAIAAALDQSLAVSTAATTTATAASTGAAVTASMAPAAATSAMASWGGSAMAGMAAMLAGMALIPSIIGQFHGGGTIPREGTYLLDGGETIYTRKQQATLMRAMEANASGGATNGGVVIHQSNTIVVENESKAEQLEEVLPELVDLTTKAVVDNINQRGDVYRARG